MNTECVGDLMSVVSMVSIMITSLVLVLAGVFVLSYVCYTFSIRLTVLKIIEHAGGYAVFTILCSTVRMYCSL
jgi:hypothetical protein